MPLPQPTDDGHTAGSLIEAMRGIGGSPCAGCRAALAHTDVLGSIAMGFKDAPRCVPCLARALGNEAPSFREQLLAYFDRRDCFRDAWAWVQRATDVTSNLVVTPAATASWDAGDMSCGELVIELRLRLQALQPGHILQLTARDPDAAQKMPAWCGQTGHRLLRAQTPDYWIERR